ncbi:MAG: hypothetical protein BWY64_03312 [bacterium ADurb.Bin363]|nr:MAG: hypothetical protein BWY64_03312 [bacterium ADurb.Bin363]
MKEVITMSLPLCVKFMGSKSTDSPYKTFHKKYNSTVTCYVTVIVYSFNIFYYFAGILIKNEEIEEI